MKEKNIGSSFDSWLEDEGIHEEVTANAIERVSARRAAAESAQDEAAAHYLHSALREKIVEHVFVGDALRWFWQHRVIDVEVLRSEFDAGGYDLVMSRGNIVRHIQFKASLAGGKRASVNASVRLLDKPSGCIIWILVDSKLELVGYRWFGGSPGKPLPDIRSMKTATHTKANAKGEKAERPDQRIIPGNRFDSTDSLGKILEWLFGPLP